ncbi:MAG: hypothetical protein GY797_09220 [Deltaproteobacteria bacterium]|nr:hypothetical protein [Deltaproteobacteria bacterium]
MSKNRNTTEAPTKTAIYMIYPISWILAGFFLGLLLWLFSLALFSNPTRLGDNLPSYLLPIYGALLGIAFVSLVIMVFERKKQPLSKYTNPKASMRIGLKWGAELGFIGGLFLVDIFLDLLNIRGLFPLFFTVVVSLIIGVIVGGLLGSAWGIIWGALLQIAVKIKMLPSDSL